MAKSTFKCHECGDSVTVVGRNRADADRLAKYREQTGALCHDCWQKQREIDRATESQKAAEEAAMTGLPVLQGTEKQIAWAESIRKAKIQKLDEFSAGLATAFAADAPEGAREVFDEGLRLVRAVDSAHWWIENRESEMWCGIRGFACFLYGAQIKGATPEKVVAQAKAHMGGLRHPAPDTTPKEIIADAKAEATVRPIEHKTETIAELLIVGNELHVTFPEKNEDFRKLAKEQLGMTWGDGYWKRLIGGMAGNIDDRLVEAGHRLLAAGFIVRIYDPELRARAVAGEFEAEHTRWITRRTQGGKAGWFCILWGRDKDYYAPARKLPRSAWDKPYVVVPPEHFEEVLDFAGRYDFRLTQSGTELAEQARVNRDAALVAKVEPKMKDPGKKITSVDKPEPMPVPENTDVDASLSDN